MISEPCSPPPPAKRTKWHQFVAEVRQADGAWRRARSTRNHAHGVVRRLKGSADRSTQTVALAAPGELEAQVVVENGVHWVYAKVRTNHEPVA